MESERHNEMLNNLEPDIVKKGFKWLSAKQINSIRKLSSTVSALLETLESLYSSTDFYGI